MADDDLTEIPSVLSAKDPSKHRRSPKTGNWGPSEDLRLRQAISKHGPRWVLVAEEVGTRNGDQCAKRWKDRLNPELDHSQWSPEEDERLLNSVGLCGHNWKFIAQNFFQSRAPLSLKNRNSLLMRRLKRQATGGGRLQQQVSVDVLKRQMQTTLDQDRHISGVASQSYGSGVTRSPGISPAEAADMANFANGSENAPYRQQRTTLYEQPVSAANNFHSLWMSGTPSATKAGAVGSMQVRDNASADAARGEGGSNARMIRSNSRSEWGDYDLSSWPQSFQTASMAGSADVDPMTGDMDDNSNDFGWGGMPMSPQPSEEAISERPPSDGQVTGGRSLRSVGLPRVEQTSKRDRRRADSPPAVEYSVTCRRGKVRAFVNHLMDAGISEIAERTAEDDNVTIKLRIDV